MTQILLNKVRCFFYSKQKFLKETFWVSFTEYLMLGVIFLVNVLLNRAYATKDVGDFNVVYSLSQIVFFGIGGVFTPILRRDLTLKDNNSLIKNVFNLRLIILVFFFVIILLINCLFNFSIAYPLFFILISRGLDILNETFYTYYQCRGKIRFYAILKSSHAFLLILFLLILVFCFNSSIFYFYFCFSFFSLIFFAINIYFFFKNVSRDLFYGLARIEGLKSTFIESVPLMFNSLIFQLKTRSSVFIIFVLLGNIATGVYSSALATITIFTAVSNPLGIVLFPKLSNIYNQKPELIIHQFRRIIFVLLILGLVFSGLHYITIDIQMNLFGELPSYSNKIFTIMTFSVPFIIALGGIGNIFVIINRLKEMVVYNIITTMLTLITFYLSIKFYSISGLAYGFVFMSVFNILLLYFLIVNLIKKSNEEIR